MWLCMTLGTTPDFSLTVSHKLKKNCHNDINKDGLMIQRGVSKLCPLEAARQINIWIYSIRSISPLRLVLYCIPHPLCITTAGTKTNAAFRVFIMCSSVAERPPKSRRLWCRDENSLGSNSGCFVWRSWRRTNACLQAGVCEGGELDQPVKCSQGGRL